MSRSRKRVAIWKQPNDRFFKRYSNKKIRRTDLRSGKMFRRVIDTWNICDFLWFPRDVDGKKRAIRK